MYEKELTKIRELYDKGCYKQEFYANKIKDRSFLESYEQFVQIPFTYKDELRTTSVFERASCAKKDVYGIFSSSGTTGDKTYYVYSNEDKKVHEKFVETFFRGIGVTADDIGAVCAPVDTGVMAHTMMWQFTTMGASYVNCPQPSPENITSLLSSVPVTIIATRPDMASGMAFRPDWTETAKKSSVRMLLTGGGFLSKGRRALLETTWQADCYNMFGMSEVFGPMAGECRMKDGQHYLDDHLLIELIDPQTGKPVPPGERGVAVYTTLWNKGFPLLRYWTDDVMSIVFDRCKCGSCLPRLYYYGRKGDCITVNGRDVFTPMLEEILLKYGFILSYQAIQGDEQVTVKVEKAPHMEIRESMLEEIRALFGVQTDVVFVEPDALGYRGHGKRMFDGRSL